MIPVVRHLIVCEELLRHSENSNKVTLVNVISTIRPTDEAGFPLVVSQVCVYAQITECRGTGKIQLRITHPDSGQTIFQSTERQLTFPNRPLDVVGIPFRILDCSFAIPGLYHVELWFDQVCLAQQPVRVEEIRHVTE